MKKLILIGRSEAGKTTLAQALRGEVLHDEKTQAVSYDGVIADTPGEYIQTKQLGGALAVYSCEADVVGLLASALEPFSLFSPAIAPMSTRPVIGIITKCKEPGANVPMVRAWLEEAGCSPIFAVDSVKGTGLSEIIAYLDTP